MSGPVESAGARASFSKLVPTLQTAWDATSLSYLLDCPRKYQTMIVEGWRPKHQAVALTFGILYHQGLEFYQKNLHLGHDAAQRGMVREIMGASGIRQPTGAVNVGDSVVMRPGRFIPWTSDDTARNRYNLIRSLVWHTEQYRDDAAQTIELDGKPAIEVSFRFQSPWTTGDGETIWLCGHMDRVANVAGLPFVIDYKTTSSQPGDYFFANFSPDTQMSFYNMAARVILEIPARGVMVDAAQIMVGFTRFARGFANRTKEQSEEFFNELPYWFRQAEVYARDGFWPKNESACSKYGGCPLREVCSKTPGLRQAFLETNFKQEFWDPLRVRT